MKLWEKTKIILKKTADIEYWTIGDLWMPGQSPGSWRALRRKRQEIMTATTLLVSCIFLSIAMLPARISGVKNENALNQGLETISYCQTLMEGKGYKSTSKLTRIYKDYHEDFINKILSVVVGGNPLPKAVGGAL